VLPSISLPLLQCYYNTHESRSKDMIGMLVPVCSSMMTVPVDKS